MKSKTKLNYILYTCNDQSEKRNWENNSIHNSMKYNKMLRNTFKKNVYFENNCWKIKEELNTHKKSHIHESEGLSMLRW